MSSIVTNKEKAKDIIESLIVIKEKLEYLPEDIHLDIDPHDNKSLEYGLRHLNNLNNNLGVFNGITDKIVEILKEFYKIDYLIKTEAGVDKGMPHSLEEDFTHTKPTSFVLNGKHYAGLTSWKNLFLKILELLEKSNEEKFKTLPETKYFISSQGRKLFSKNKNDLQVAVGIADDFFVEVNFSANYIRNNIQKLLKYFSLNPADMKIYLR